MRRVPPGHSAVTSGLFDSALSTPIIVETTLQQMCLSAMSCAKNKLVVEMSRKTVDSG